MPPLLFNIVVVFYLKRCNLNYELIVKRHNISDAELYTKII